MLVLLEGLDFSGKTTLLRLLSHHFHQAGYKVICADGGSLTGGRYRNFVLQATNDHAFPRWVQTAVHRTTILVDRLFYRKPENAIIFHCSYIDRSLAYEIARKNKLSIWWMRFLQRVAIRHHLRILLNTRFDVRVERYLASGILNSYDDNRFFNQDSQIHFQRMDVELQKIAKSQGYWCIDTSDQTEEETLNAVTKIVQLHLDKWFDHG